MATLTLFTAPKPFTNPHIATIQRNAIRSWLALGPEVEVLLIGEEEGLAETAAELGVRCLPQVARNASGTPLVHSIFDLARQNSNSPLLGYVNADILFTPAIAAQARQVADQVSNFLLVGQRWDLDVREPLEFTPGWETALEARVQREGKRHKATGSDYFIFPRACFADMPPFAIGRAAWDNWMIYAGRVNHWPVIDGSDSVFLVHQNHDYSHLPGGKPHYHLPESDENLRLAGGKRAVFQLPDASHRLVNGKIVSHPFSWERLAREIEIFPLVQWRSRPLAQVTYFIFHPVKAYREWRAAARRSAPNSSLEA